jgi:F-type H+-transporting ATPase subunit a
MSFLLAFADPMQHVLSHPVGQDWSEDLRWNPAVIDNHIIMQVFATVLLLLILLSAFRSRAARSGDDVEALVPKGTGNFFEAICSYLRNEVARPTLAEYTDRFIGFIWTVFFFILFCNLLGMVPLDAVLGLFMAHPPHIGGTATGNIFVTATLALCTMLMMVINGLRLGGMHYLAHFCPGPLWLAPLLVPVEILGVFAKIFALTVRLFANMMAGHILLATLISFAALLGGFTGVGIAIPSILGAVAISCLEIFVAFLQAFIFTFLTALFIGQSIVFHHDEHHEAA